VGTEFGNLLYRHRRRLGLSQEQLARRSGLAIRTIRNLERSPGNRPRRDSVRLLANALGLDGEERDLFDQAAASELSLVPAAGTGSKGSAAPIEVQITRRLGRVALAAGALCILVLAAGTTSFIAQGRGHARAGTGPSTPICPSGGRQTLGSGPLAASCRHVWLGVYEANNADTSVRERCPAGGSSVCRRFDVFSRYYSLSQLAASAAAGRWPTADDARFARGGRQLFLTISSRCEGACPSSFDGQPLPPPANLAISANPAVRPMFRPQDVADGRLDPLLHAAATALRVFPGPVLVAFGPPIDEVVVAMSDHDRAAWECAYRDMMRHVHDLFAADGVTNVAWNYMVAGTVADPTVYEQSFPGDAYADWISWTAYDRACSAGSAYASIDRFYERLQLGLLGAGATAKPYALAEYGAGAACQAARLGTLVAGLQRLPQIRAFVYQSPADDPVMLTPSGWAALANAGHLPYMAGPRP
jgi:transcriptional regulator with XRE-family HTH domain